MLFHYSCFLFLNFALLYWYIIICMALGEKTKTKNNNNNNCPKKQNWKILQIKYKIKTDSRPMKFVIYLFIYRLSVCVSIRIGLLIIHHPLLPSLEKQSDRGCGLESGSGNSAISSYSQAKTGSVHLILLYFAVCCHCFVDILVRSQNNCILLFPVEARDVSALNGC